VSVESADIILMHDELSKLTAARRLAVATMRIIKQNLIISLTYNLIMVPLAMAGFLTLLLAAISMPISSLAVILNAARLRNAIQPHTTTSNRDQER
jgi:Cu2+-exporting ATPase